jgi:hypothetical protein
MDFLKKKPNNLYTINENWGKRMQIPYPMKKKMMKCNGETFCYSRTHQPCNNNKHYRA